GLVNIPLGSVLFGTNHKEQDRGELMIALIPHIVRTPDYSPENLKGIFAGTDQSVKLTYAPPPLEEAAPPAPAPAAAKPEPPAAAPPVAPGNPARVSFAPGSIQVAPGAPVQVNVQLENANDAFSATPIHIKWDPTMLRMNDLNPGDFLTRDGGRVTSVKDIR